MNNRILSLLVVLLISSATFATAGEAKSPSLTGSWSAKYPVAFTDEFGQSGGTITITEQNGALFRGYMVWARQDKKMTDKEPFAGVIDFDGKTVVFVQDHDGGVLKGRLTNANTMQVVMTQSSPNSKTLAYRAVFVRQ